LLARLEPLRVQPYYWTITTRLEWRWKWSTLTNTLAYSAAKLITAKKFYWAGTWSQGSRGLLATYKFFKNLKIILNIFSWLTETWLVEINKISQNFTKFHKISQNFTKFHKISQNFTIFHKITQNFTKFHKISQNFTKLHKISQHITKFHKISQNLWYISMQ